jgi:DNA-binding MarR family transcriptional regulator/N-acetylglutamate synthase-like GNAT family acetyltransferase
MSEKRQWVAESSDVTVVRAFNRFYTARLGLLQKRYLNGEYSLTESRILYEIGTTPRVTAASLCERLMLDKGYISRLLGALTRAGLVRQMVSRVDNRERLLKLTAAGEKKVAALNEQSSAQIEGMLGKLKGNDRAEVVGALRKVRLLLEKDSEARLRVERLAEVTDEALELLEEYYESVGVILRDTPEDVGKYAKDPQGGVWLAYLDERAVGCAYLRRLSSIAGATECKRLYVRPSARGMGVATTLLDAQEKFARELGLKRIYLDSKDDLQVAIAIYRKRGYEPCERYNKNPQATVFLMKELAEE